MVIRSSGLLFSVAAAIKITRALNAPAVSGFLLRCVCKNPHPLIATRRHHQLPRLLAHAIAAGTLFAARIHGVDVPQQLSIVGFEDSPFSRQAWPNLTTAQQPNATIAECATGLLIDTIRNKRDVESEGFYPQLIVRDSTCPAPSKR
jgi:hypothetical protein